MTTRSPTNKLGANGQALPIAYCDPSVTLNYQQILEKLDLLKENYLGRTHLQNYVGRMCMIGHLAIVKKTTMRTSC